MWPEPASPGPAAPFPGCPPLRPGPWRRQPRGLPAQVAHKEGHGGGGDHSTAGATGRAPPLPVSSTNGPSSCACAKGKLQLSKTKTPKEELPWRPWKTAGPPPRIRGLPEQQPGAGRRWVPALPPAAGLACCPVLPPWWTGDLLAERGAHSLVSWGAAQRRPQGPPAPTPWPGSRTRRWGGCSGWQSPHHTHPASGRRSSQKSPRPGPPGTSA